MREEEETTCETVGLCLAFFSSILYDADERVKGCCCSVKAGASGVRQGVNDEALQARRVQRAAAVSHFSQRAHTEEDSVTLEISKTIFVPSMCTILH